MAEIPQAETPQAKEPSINETPLSRLQATQTLLRRFEAVTGITGTAALARVLGGRWSYWQVRDWRRGRNQPPREAMERLSALLRERVARYEILAVACGRAELGKHAPNILAWNARRAALGR